MWHSAPPGSVKTDQFHLSPKAWAIAAASPASTGWESSPEPTNDSAVQMMRAAHRSAIQRLVNSDDSLGPNMRGIVRPEW